MGQLDAVADAVGAAGQPGVDQPGLRVVTPHALGQHLGIFERMPHQKGGAEAGRERSLRLGHAHLGTGHFGRVAADEVVHRLFGRQAGHRRQHTEGIVGQKDDIARVAAHAGNLGVLDELDGVGGAGVLRDGGVGVVHLARFRIVDDVFEHGSEPDRVVDLRLAFGRKVDHLGVAAPLDVEDALVRPAVLVVADQAALGIGRKRRFACARQPEEQRHVAVRSFVGRAVHREHTAQRHQVVHHGKDAFFHLAGVLRAEDHYLAPLKREIDARLRGHVRGVAIGRETPRVEDHVVRLAELGQLLAGGANQHVVHEEGMVGALADHPHLDPVLGIPAGKAVDHVEPFPGIQVVEGPLAVDQERVLVERNVDGAPPDVFLAFRVFDDALVGRAASRLGAGGAGQRPAADDGRPGIVAHRLLVEHRRRRIPQHVRYM